MPPEIPLFLCILFIFILFRIELKRSEFLFRPLGSIDLDDGMRFEIILLLDIPRASHSNGKKRLFSW